MGVRTTAVKQKCRRCAADFLPIRDEMRCPQCAIEVSELLRQDDQRHRERFSRGKSLDSGAAA